MKIGTDRYFDLMARRASQMAEYHLGVMTFAWTLASVPHFVALYSSLDMMAVPKEFLGKRKGGLEISLAKRD